MGEILIQNMSLRLDEPGAPIGEGRYSQVYAALDSRSGKSVVLKVFRTLNDEHNNGQDPSLEWLKYGYPRHVLREIHILSTLKHKNIVDFICAAQIKTSFFSRSYPF